MSRPVHPDAALATLSHERFFEPGWIYERKLDGERCLAKKADGRVRLSSRSGRDVTSSFPEVAEELEGDRTPDFFVDGEIVAFDGSRTSFAKLQPRIQVADAARARATGIPVWYYVFDVLEVDGEDLRARPLRERKQRLRELLDYRGPLRYTPHRNVADEAYFGEICGKGWEGLIVKRADAAHAPGRSRNWLKFKCEGGQEFVIGGYTEPEGSRTGFGALLLGYYQDGTLRYAGKVGTGFDRELLESLTTRMRRLETGAPAFDAGKLPTRAVHWLRPELVGEVGFTEWTSAGQLRHPRFLGLRRDKPAKDVVRE